jgi:hypothetical protein
VKFDPSEWDEYWQVGETNLVYAFGAACRTQVDVEVFKAIFEHAGDRVKRLWKQTEKELKWTPLHVLCFYRVSKDSISPDVLEFLLSTVTIADWGVCDEEGWTPLHYALDYGYGEKSRIKKDILEVILKHGGSKVLFVAEPNYNFMPFAGVLAKKDEEMIELLMEYGGSEKLMKYKDQMSEIEKWLRDVAQSMDAKTRKKVIEAIQKGVSRYYVRKVGDMPNTKEYLEGVGIGLQDLPKHLIEDKIVPKIGGKRRPKTI